MSDDPASLWREIARERREIADDRAALEAERQAFHAERADVEQSPAVTSDQLSVRSDQEPPTIPDTVAEPPDVSDTDSGSHVRHVALVTAAEAARRLSVSPTTLSRLRARGELPAVKVGKRGVRYRADDIAAYLDQNRD